MADRRLQTVLLCSGMLVSVWGAPAFAQATQPQAAPQAVEGQDAAGDIVVTARRRAESIQAVPLSVAAFSSETLTRSNVVQLQDVTQIVPGFTAQATSQGTAALTLAIRGQRQGLTNSIYESPVSVYQDEVILARPQGLNQSFFDIASVQVLKGPQGTLFGRNVTGGAVLITTNKPTDEFGGYVTAGVGNYDLRRGEGALNVPIAPWLQLRVAGSIVRRDGYTDNPRMGRKVDNQHSEGWRASLRIAPVGSGFENVFVWFGSHQREDGTVFKLVSVQGLTAGARGAQSVLDTYATKPFRYVLSNVPDDGTLIRTDGFTNTASVDVGGLTFKNITGYRRVKAHQYYDLSGGDIFLIDSQQDFTTNQFSNEFQAQGTTLANSLDYVAGFYYFQEQGSETQLTRTTPTGPNNSLTDFSSASRSYAAYAQVTYRPEFLRNVSLTAGVRYTRDERELISRARTSGGSCRVLSADVGGVPISPCFRKVGTDFEKPTYTFAIDWKFDGENMIYFTQRYGYQAGGYTNSALRPAEFVPYLPQTVMDYEAGLKTKWRVAGLRGRTNFTVYRDNYKDIQRLFSDTVTVGGATFSRNRIQNAATARIQGIEVDSTIDIGDALQLTTGYAFTDARYRAFFVNGVDFTNSDFVSTPRHQLTGSARLKLPVPESAAHTYLQVNGSYQSSTVTQDTTSFNPVTGKNRSTAVLPAYTLLNARLDFEDVMEKPLRISLWAKNLLDKDYYSAGQDSSISFGSSLRILGAPRTYGAEVSYRF